MNVPKISTRNIRITPTEKKLRRAGEFAKEVTASILPKEMPIERRYYISSAADKFDMVKNKIQIAVEKMTSAK